MLTAMRPKAIKEKTSGEMSKIYSENIRLYLEQSGGRTQRCFLWRSKHYVILRILRSWRVRHSWWRPKEVRRVYFRVEVASGGIYDIFFDRIMREWVLERVWD